MNIIISTNSEQPQYPIGSTYYIQEQNFYRYAGCEWEIVNELYIYAPHIPGILKSVNHIDELYVYKVVQKAKNDGYLIIEDNLEELYRNPINIKYLNWCRRGNIPYLVAYKNEDSYNIELRLNPRNPYIGFVFKNESYDIFTKLLRGNRITYTEDSYIIYDCSKDFITNILPSIVKLFRNYDNLELGY